jgi:hypothetical protein
MWNRRELCTIAPTFYVNSYNSPLNIMILMLRSSPKEISSSIPCSLISAVNIELPVTLVKQGTPLDRELVVWLDLLDLSHAHLTLFGCMLYL